MNHISLAPDRLLESGLAMRARRDAQDGYDAVEWRLDSHFQTAMSAYTGFRIRAWRTCWLPHSGRLTCRPSPPAMTVRPMYDGWAFHGSGFAPAFDFSWHSSSQPSTLRAVLAASIGIGHKASARGGRCRG